jgi:hypothetical protein
MSFTDLLETAKRRSIVLAEIVGLLLTATALSAQTPNMSGTWEMDAGKSHVSDGRTITLAIESVTNKLKVDSIMHDKGGKEINADFTCAPDGKECEFNEGGHKSKVSMWFSGDSLNVAKTDGPVGDVVDEWKLQMSTNGKVLTLAITHIDPDAPVETLVFNKKT